MRSTQDYRPLIALILLCTIWGSNLTYMKLAAEQITLLQYVFFRVLFGFAPVAVYAYATRLLSWSHLKYSHHFLAMALLATAIYYYGFAKGTSLPLSGVAGALSGAIPFFSFLLVVLFIAEERATRVKISGVFIGFIGVVMIGRPLARMTTLPQ